MHYSSETLALKVTARISTSREHSRQELQQYAYKAIKKVYWTHSVRDSVTMTVLSATVYVLLYKVTLSARAQGSDDNSVHKLS